jgi:co-chaperonin GroES (HSP10)
MKFHPRNRHLLVELIPEEEAQQPAVLLPENYKPNTERYVPVKVIERAPDCKIDSEMYPGTYVEGNIVIVESSMLNEVKYGGEVFHLILENYVLGVVE